MLVASIPLAFVLTRMSRSEAAQRMAANVTDGNRVKDFNEANVYPIFM